MDRPPLSCQATGQATSLPALDRALEDVATNLDRVGSPLLAMLHRATAICRCLAALADTDKSRVRAVDGASKAGPPTVVTLLPTRQATASAATRFFSCIKL